MNKTSAGKAKFINQHRFSDAHSARLVLPRDKSSPLRKHLILEVTGAKGPDKAAKVHTARALWVPAVNNHGGFGRWDFHEVRDPWDVKEDLRSCIKEASGERAVVRIT